MKSLIRVLLSEKSRSGFLTKLIALYWISNYIQKSALFSYTKHPIVVRIYQGDGGSGMRERREL
jgi:hypothetical protein